MHTLSNTICFIKHIHSPSSHCQTHLQTYKSKYVQLNSVISSASLDLFLSLSLTSSLCPCLSCTQTHNFFHKHTCTTLQTNAFTLRNTHSYTLWHTYALNRKTFFWVQICSHYNAMRERDRQRETHTKRNSGKSTLTHNNAQANSEHTTSCATKQNHFMEKQNKEGKRTLRHFSTTLL